MGTFSPIVAQEEKRFGPGNGSPLTMRSRKSKRYSVCNIDGELLSRHKLSIAFNHEGCQKTSAKRLKQGSSWAFPKWQFFSRSHVFFIVAEVNEAHLYISRSKYAIP